MTSFGEVSVAAVSPFPVQVSLGAACAGAHAKVPREGGRARKGSELGPCWIQFYIFVLIKPY